MKELDQITAVSFDLDDTLWECAPAIALAEKVLAQWLQKHAPRLDKTPDKQSLSSIRQQVLSVTPALANDVSALRQQVLVEYLAQANYDAALAKQAFAQFYKARSNVTLYDGVHELLSALQTRFKLAAITNGNADLELVGIAHYFDDMQHATVRNAPKPDVQMFDACLQNLNLKRENLLHVGDNPETDVQGGHNAGVHTVWFNQHGAQWPEHLLVPSISVSSLAQLQKLLIP